jgi:hypothetical protein
VPGATGTLTAFNSHDTQPKYRKVVYPIDVLDWPAGTTQIKIRFETYTRATSDPEGRLLYDTIWLDQVRCYISSIADALTCAWDLDDIRGFVKPFVHAKLGAAETDLEFALRGNLTDGTNDITPLAEVTSAEDQTMYNVWFYLDMAGFEIPNARISDNAALTDFDQEFSFDIDSLDAAFTPISLDDLVLLPIDNGYCAIPGLENNLYYIVDSQSEMPMVLVSYDGTIDKAAWHSQASMSRRFRLDPQNGSNLAILETPMDSNWNDIGQFLMNVSIKYKPRFLLAP